MPPLNSADFFATWHHALDSDFQKEGKIASYYHGHPQQWGAETRKIQLQHTPNHIALNEDETLIAVAMDSEVLIYDMSTLNLRQTLRGHAGHVSEVEFQPKGRKLVSCSSVYGGKRETLVRLWDLDEELHRGSHGLAVLSKAAATASESAAATLLQSSAWTKEDVRTSKLQDGFNEQGTLAPFRARPFSHDGSMLLYISGRKTIVSLDVETLKERFRLVGHTDAIMWAETSPDDSIIASSSWDKTVRLWDAATGAALRTLQGSTNQSWSAAFSPDGQLIAAGSGDRHVRIWRVETGELIHTLEGFKDWIRSFAFSPDGFFLAAGASRGTLRIFDVRSGNCEQFWQVKPDEDSHPGVGLGFIEVTDVQYTARGDLVFKTSDGRRFGYRADQNLKWKFEHDPSTKGAPGYGNTIVTRNGSILICVDHDDAIRFWKLEDD